MNDTPMTIVSIVISIAAVCGLLSIAPGMPVSAQESELIPVTSCLRTTPDNIGEWANIYGELVDYPGPPTPEEEDSWTTCYGPALPDDIHLRQWLQFGDVWLAILDAESTPDRFWVMVFDSLRITTDTNGNNEGFHDICGLFMVYSSPGLLPRDYYMNRAN